jgi:hypothetical protein
MDCTVNPNPCESKVRQIVYGGVFIYGERRWSGFLVCSLAPFVPYGQTRVIRATCDTVRDQVGTIARRLSATVGVPNTGTTAGFGSGYALDPPRADTRYVGYVQDADLYYFHGWADYGSDAQVFVACANP